MDTTALKMEETSAQCSSIGTLKNVSDQLQKPQQRNIETHLDSSGADKISDSINNTNNNQKDTDSESSKITSTLEAVIESAICSRSVKPTSLSYMASVRNSPKSSSSSLPIVCGTNNANGNNNKLSMKQQKLPSSSLQSSSSMNQISQSHSPKTASISKSQSAAPTPTPNSTSSKPPSSPLSLSLSSTPANIDTKTSTSNALLTTTAVDAAKDSTNCNSNNKTSTTKITTTPSSSTTAKTEQNNGPSSSSTTSQQQSHQPKSRRKSTPRAKKDPHHAHGADDSSRNKGVGSSTMQTASIPSLGVTQNVHPQATPLMLTSAPSGPIMLVHHNGQCFMVPAAQYFSTTNQQMNAAIRMGTPQQQQQSQVPIQSQHQQQAQQLVRSNMVSSNSTATLGQLARSLAPKPASSTSASSSAQASLSNTSGTCGNASTFIQSNSSSLNQSSSSTNNHVTITTPQHVSSARFVSDLSNFNANPQQQQQQAIFQQGIQIRATAPVSAGSTPGIVLQMPNGAYTYVQQLVAPSQQQAAAATQLPTTSPSITQSLTHSTTISSPATISTCSLPTTTSQTTSTSNKNNNDKQNPSQPTITTPLSPSSTPSHQKQQQTADEGTISSTISSVLSSTANASNLMSSVFSSSHASNNKASSRNNSKHHSASSKNKSSANHQSNPKGVSLSSAIMFPAVVTSGVSTISPSNLVPIGAPMPMMVMSATGISAQQLSTAFGTPTLPIMGSNGQIIAHQPLISTNSISNTHQMIPLLQQQQMNTINQQQHMRFYNLSSSFNNNANINNNSANAITTQVESNATTAPAVTTTHLTASSSEAATTSPPTKNDSPKTSQTNATNPKKRHSASEDSTTQQTIDTSAENEPPPLLVQGECKDALDVHVLFMKEADRYARKVGRKGKIIHLIEGFEIEESDEPFDCDDTAMMRIEDCVPTELWDRIRLSRSPESCKKTPSNSIQQQECQTALKNEKKTSQKASVGSGNKIAEAATGRKARNNTPSSSAKEELSLSDTSPISNTTSAPPQKEKKKRKRKTNELDRLLQMDFGPAQGRLCDILGTTTVLAKETTKNKNSALTENVNSKNKNCESSIEKPSPSSSVSNAEERSTSPCKKSTAVPCTQQRVDDANDDEKKKKKHHTPSSQTQKRCGLVVGMRSGASPPSGVPLASSSPLDSESTQQKHHLQTLNDESTTSVNDLSLNSSKGIESGGDGMQMNISNNSNTSMRALKTSVSDEELDTERCNYCNGLLRLKRCDNHPQYCSKKCRKLWKKSAALVEDQGLNDNGTVSGIPGLSPPQQCNSGITSAKSSPSKDLSVTVVSSVPLQRSFSTPNTFASIPLAIPTSADDNNQRSSPPPTTLTLKKVSPKQAEIVKSPRTMSSSHEVITVDNTSNDNNSPAKNNTSSPSLVCASMPNMSSTSSSSDPSPYYHQNQQYYHAQLHVSSSSSQAHSLLTVCNKSSATSALITATPAITTTTSPSIHSSHLPYHITSTNQTAISTHQNVHSSSTSHNNNSNVACATSTAIEKCQSQSSPSQLHFMQKAARTWTCEEVAKWVAAVTGSEDCAGTFHSQDIDGQSLLLLAENPHHNLGTLLGLKLGPVVKIQNALRELAAKSINAA